MTDDFGRRSLILSVSAGREQLHIQASPERWEVLFRQAMTGQIENHADVLRGMYVRGEIEIETLEEQL
jgi:hypothetical protein